MAAYLNQLLDAHRVIQATLETDEQAVAAREAAASAELLACEQAREEIAYKRRVLAEAQKIYEDMIENKVTTDIATEKSNITREAVPEFRQRRARIGPQRYVALDILRELGIASADQLAQVSGLDAKRIREIVRSDVLARVIQIIPEDDDRYQDDVARYEMSEEGFKLLDRYEAYKASKGEHLPTVMDARKEELGHTQADPNEDDFENTEADEMDTGKVPSSASGLGDFG